MLKKPPNIQKILLENNWFVSFNSKNIVIDTTWKEMSFIKNMMNERYLLLLITEIIHEKDELWHEKICASKNIYN